MDREKVIRTLRAHEVELREAGVVSLRLFGSVARGDARPDSDVDLAARFGKRISLFEFAGIQDKLSHLLGAPADLADADRLKDYVRENFDREAQLVF